MSAHELRQVFEDVASDCTVAIELNNRAPELDDLSAEADPALEVEPLEMRELQKIYKSFDPLLLREHLPEPLML